MNHKSIGQLIFLLLAGVVFAGNAMALTADDSGFRQGVLKAVRPVRKAPLQALKSAASGFPGIDVVWDRDTGAPAKVSGPGLASLGEDAFEVLTRLSPLFGISDATGEFTVQRDWRDSLGYRHVRMRQQWHGIPVVGGELIVHFDSDGIPYQVNGKFFPGLDKALGNRHVPGVRSDRAVTLAKAYVGLLGMKSGQVAKDPELMVYAMGDTPCLVFDMSLRCVSKTGAPALWRVWMDAGTGEILNSYDDVQKIMTPTHVGEHAALQGNLLDGEGGAVTNVAGWYDELMRVYVMYNTNMRWTVYNYASSGYDDSASFAFRSTTNWSDSDTVEMSAAHAFALTQDYYRNVHDRNSFDNLGAYATANVHVGTSYVNAYWDGLDFHFGDGNGEMSNPLGVLDVCAHEFTHAVTLYTAALYYQNESGALNESFSDVFASLVEFRSQPDGRSAYPSAKPGHADWLIGEDCWLSATALRDMRDPASKTTIDDGEQQPSRYRGTYWFTGLGDNGGVHVNNGVQNFFFYLLCEGGSGVNDGITYSVDGIGITNAGQVAYRTLTTYCTQLTNYRDARDAWISAARDINTDWVNSVSAAWDAVGVSAAGSAGPTSANDYNADGSADLAVYNRLTGNWFIKSLTGDVLAWNLNFGASGFLPAPGDYDGGGATDLAVYNPSTGEWYVLLVESGTMLARRFGGSGYVPVPSDYDGDGITDMAVYHTTTGAWYIWAATGSILAWGYNFGSTGYVPVPGDYDAGGETDYAVYNQPGGIWYFRHRETGLQDSGLFGGPRLIPAQADYDGDGMTDPGVYDQVSGQWYIWSRRGSLIAWGTVFGGAGLVPVPGDYDGGGSDDIAVYQESTGKWYILLSESGLVVFADFGGPDMTPAGAWQWGDVFFQ